ncbi:MAG: protein kinase [Planctomycetota bacterium]|nr:protein kinase [Planctomycetota bacterium]
MSNSRPSDSHDPRLDRILAEYVESAESGTPQNADDWAARYPEFAAELREFISVRRQLGQAVRNAAEELSPSAFDAPTFLGQTGDRDESLGSPNPPRIRYFGDYELLAEIARGGMGVVYKARQVNLDRVVALKMILAGQFADDSAVTRFHAEAAAAAKLDHPGIVPIFEIGEHAGQHYFSMAYVAGTSLAKRVAEGPLPERTAAELVAKIADAVQYAHEQGIVHRDLKPANVLLDEAGQPRVTDFGLAKQLESDSGLTGTGQVLGTPSYMPPEQAAGRTGEIGPRTDVYSLGALLYCLLTGRPPFQAASALDTVMQVLEHEPVPPRELIPQVSADLETIVLKCLEKESARRYSTARELADELRRFLRGEPIVARPISGTERLWKWIRRRPVVAALSAAVVLSLTVGSLATLYFAVQADIRATEATRMANNEKDARTNLQANYYVNQIARSYSEWRAGNTSQAVKILDETDADQRSWEWNFLRRLCSPQARVLDHSSGATRQVEYSPSGRYLVASTEYQDVQIWDLTTDERIATPRLHSARIAAIAFTPDESRILSVDLDGTAIVWDRVTGELMAKHTGWRGVTVLEFNSDGSRLLTNFGVRDLATGELIPGWTGGVQMLGLTFGPDESEIWTMQSGGLVRYSAAGEALDDVSQRPAVLQGNSVVFSRDRQRIVAIRSRLWANSNENWWGVFDSRTLEPVTWLGKVGSVDPVGFSISPNGRRVAITTKPSYYSHSDRLLTVWDALNGQELVRLRGPHPLLDSPVFDPSGERLAWANGSAVLIWQFPQRREARRIATTGGPLIGMGISDAASCIVWGDRTGDIQEIDLETGDFRRSFSQLYSEGRFDERTRLALSPSGERIALSNNLSLDVVSRRDPGTPVRVQNMSVSGYFTQALFSQRESQVIAADAVALKRWNSATGARDSNDVELNNASAIARSVDGTRLAVARMNQGTSQPAGEQQPDSVPPDQNPIEIFDADKLQRQRTIGGLPSPASCLAFAPDGKLLAAGTGRNSASYGLPPPVAGVIRIWNVETGAEVARLPGHSVDVLRIAFSHDGRRLFSASIDGTVRLWDVKTRQEVLILRGHPNEVQDLALSESGWLTTGGGQAMTGDGEILLWDGRAFDPSVLLPTLEWPGAPPNETPFARPHVEPLTLRGFEGAIAGIAATANERFIAAWPYGDQQPLVIWDTHTGEIIRRISPVESGISGAAFHPDGSVIAVVFSNGMAAGTMHVMEVESGDYLTTMPGAIDRPAYNADGSLLATGYADGQGSIALRVWNAGNGEPHVTVPGAWYRTCLNSDGSRVAGALGSNVVVADAAAGKTLLTYREPGDMVRNLALSPAGDLIAASGSGISNIPGTLQIRRVPGGELVHELRGHSGMFANAVFSADGSRLASCCFDRTIKIWDVGSGRLRRTLRSNDNRPEYLVFSTDSRRLITGNDDGTVRIWTIDE